MRLHDVVSMAAPPWGGPAMTGRVMRYVEEYGRGWGIWEQRIRLGGLAACLTVQDNLNNDTSFEFEPRLAQSGAARVGRALQAGKTGL